MKRIDRIERWLGLKGRGGDSCRNGKGESLRHLVHVPGEEILVVAVKARCMQAVPVVLGSIALRLEERTDVVVREPGLRWAVVCALLLWLPGEELVLGGLRVSQVDGHIVVGRLVLLSAGSVE